MTVIQPPTWMQQATYDAKNDRLHIGGMFQSAGATKSDAFTITQTATPSMEVIIGSGTAYIDSAGFISWAGLYCLVNDAPINRKVQPADAVNPRVDLVIARVYDAYYQGSDNRGDIEILPGQPAVSPSAPALPAGAIEIGRISVAANASSILTANINNTTMTMARLRQDLLFGNSTAWTAYTPTFTNIVIGTGATVTTAYTSIGKIVHYRGQIILGTGFSLNASSSISVPLAMNTGHSSNSFANLGVTSYQDVGTALYAGWARANSATAMTLMTSASPSIDISNAAPFTWVAGDRISWNISYEAA